MKLSSAMHGHAIAKSIRTISEDYGELFDADTMAAAIRQAVWNIDPDLRVGTMLTRRASTADPLEALRAE